MTSEVIRNMQIRRLTTPRAAALSGILFSLLFAASLLLIRTAIPADLSAGTDWVTMGSNQIKLTLFLMPLAGIAFLWFIGVVRDRLGTFEDQFFSTVFFGSSLLFLAMVFVSMAIAGGLLDGAKQHIETDVLIFGRSVMFHISNIYALRMAGVFMISLGTIWWRTGLMPRWSTIVTYLLALVLLLVINLSLWVTLIFPGWVFIISTLTLFLTLKNSNPVSRIS